MKKIYSLFVFGLFAQLSSAQSYVPIPQTNATWFHTWHDWDWMQPNWQQTVYTLGDTLINATTYTKIGETTLAQNGMLYSSYLGAFRNDSVAQMVYIVPKDSLNERTLYAFDVDPGDTIANAFCFEYYGSFAAPSPVDEFYVAAVDSFLLGSDYRKMITVNTTPSTTGSVKWFEGFGSNQGLLGSPDLASVSYWQEWECAVFGNDQYSYVWDSVVIATGPCMTTLDLPLESLAHFEVYPNPFSERFEISPASAHNYAVTIFNARGERIYATENNSGSLTVSLEAQPKGMYFLEIRHESGLQHVKLSKL
jgi:hypothetical protein